MRSEDRSIQLICWLQNNFDRTTTRIMPRNVAWSSRLI